MLPTVLLHFMSTQFHADEGFHEDGEVFGQTVEVETEEVIVEEIKKELKVSPKPQGEPIPRHPKTNGHWGFGQTSGIV